MPTGNYFDNWLFIDIDDLNLKLLFTDSYPCPRYSTRPVQYRNRAYRLVTPTVVWTAQQHFNCSTESKFGGPLQYEVQKTII